MTPASQRFRAAGFSGGYVYDGLVVNFQLVIRYCATQVLAELVPGVRMRIAGIEPPYSAPR